MEAAILNFPPVWLVQPPQALTTSSADRYSFATLFSDQAKNFHSHQTMGFKSQLKWLCWKNIITKKRNKLRLAIELLMPITLFLLLMFLRRIGDKKIYPDCYFKPKAMPSAGDMAFYQSFYCSLNNTCDDSVANASISTYDGSFVSTLMKALEESFDLAPPELETRLSNATLPNENNTEQIRRFLKPVQEAIKDDAELSQTDLGKIIASLNIPTDRSNRKYVCGRMPTPSRRNIQPFNENDDPGGNAMDTLSNETDIKRDDDTMNNGNITIESFADSPILKILDFFFCGPNVPVLAKQLESMAKLTENSWERKKEEIESQSTTTRPEFVETEYENDTTPFCNDLMRRLDQSVETRFVWRMFKPFVRGKIVYTPDAPAVKKFMNRIHKKFTALKDFMDEFLEKIQELPGLKELNLIRENDKFLTRIAKSEAGLRLLEFFQVKVDGDLEDAKTVDTHVKSLRKLLDNVIDLYNRQAGVFRPAFNVSAITNYLDCVDWSRTIPVTDPEDALDVSLDWLASERLWALVEFVNVSANATELPPSITYKIRTGIERTHATFQLRDRIYRPKVRRNPFIDLKHITGGWAYMQNLIESELIREYTGRKKVPGIYLQQTPYPCHIVDMFRESITRTFPMFMIVSWIFLFSTLIKKIVWEKEKRVTQTLRVMGVGKAAHWLAWFLDAFIPMFFVSFALTFILVFGKIIPNSSFFLVWLFLVAFIIPTIMLAFLVSTCFIRANIASAVSGLLFLLIYLPYPPVSQFEESINPDLKVSLCLVSNIAFGLGCTWIANMEELGIGGQLSNINVSPVPGNPITMTLILGMFLLDAVIYLLLALYIENIFPGGDGLGRPYYFLFTKSYWLGKSTNDDDLEDNFTKAPVDPEKFEAEPEGLSLGVSMENVSKEFGRKKALDQLTVNFFEDQITSFLGHNGAGKSTAISIMTGLLAPTSGTVRLNGKTLKAEDELQKQDIGICGQENVLLEDLTVEEHLYFYSRMKDVSHDKAMEDAYTMMKDVGIIHKRHTQTKNLSGGTQRKVCVAIAFIGGSKVIFLDEPTAGVDPASRRSIWDLLIKYKKGRTVILTTHFMDEADLLGDRIAIIAKGQIVCCGSPVFLKTKLGSGYYLTIDCENRSDNIGRSPYGTVQEETAVVKDLKEVIEAVVPDAKFLEQIASEVIFVIPLQPDVTMYDKLFKTLDTQRNLQKIKSYGISDTSLEEIFLKIAEDSEANGNSKRLISDDLCSCFGRKKYDAIENNFQEIPHGVSLANQPGQSGLPEKLSKWQEVFNEFSALIVKRAIHHQRNYTALIVEIVLPAAFMALALYISSLLPSIRHMPPQEIDVKAYGPSHMFYSLDFPNDPLLKSYERALLGPVGLGSQCVVSAGTCSNVSISSGSLISHIYEKVDTTPCPCKNGRYECPAPPPTPPYTQMSSGDRIYNLTGQNITNWIVKTELADSYIRYGGVTMGYRRVFNSVNFLDILNIFQLNQLLPIFGAFLGQMNNWEGFTSESADNIVSALLGFCSKPIGDEILKNAEINDNIIIWYNNRGWISGIAFMNAVSNMVLRASLPPDKDPSKYSISLINHPLPISARQFEDEIDKQANISILRAMAVIWALAFIPGTYAVYLIQERSSGFKHLQIVSGVRRLNYWLSGLFWDVSCFCVTVVIVVIVFLCFNETAFVGKDSIVAFFLLLLSYGFVSVTFVYPLSFFFNVPSTGFVAISTASIFIGSVTLLTTFVLSIISEDENPYHLNTLFLIFPQFCLGKALLNMSILSIRVRTFASLGIIAHPEYLDWETSLKFVTLMIIMGFVFLIVTFLIEFRSYFPWGRKLELPDDLVINDDDVLLEKERVISGEAKTEGDVLLVDNLSKKYNKEGSFAVERLCFGVKQGECFGLLGLNGAGKTTVFKMLTGIVKPSSGNASVLGKSILDEFTILPMGYCPQTNALDSYLTPKEHLIFFGRLRGLTGNALSQMVAQNIEKLGLEIHKDKISSSLSGGNKRKLNTAIALTGDPRLILLDEPTSGMDPRARRFLWQCVHKCVQEGRSVLLTSHSMEECQSLCTRLGIMVNGKFCCFGTCQHLKAKFDEGYSVVVRCRGLTNMPEVKRYMESSLPLAGNLEVNYLQLKMRLNPGASLGQVFTALDAAKKKSLIRDYSISQTTLEQIFIKFASYQKYPSSEDEATFFKRHLPCCCGNTEDEADSVDSNKRESSTQPNGTAVQLTRLSPNNDVEVQVLDNN